MITNNKYVLFAQILRNLPNPLAFKINRKSNIRKEKHETFAKEFNICSAGDDFYVKSSKKLQNIAQNKLKFSLCQE